MIPRRQVLSGLAVGAGLLAACERRTTADTHTQTTKNSSVINSNADSQAKSTPKPIYVLDAQTLEDALVGSSYLGCGGGGSLSEARALLKKDLEAGLDFHMLKVADLQDDDRVACPYGLGSTAPLTAEFQAKLDAVKAPVDEHEPVQAAFSHLQDHLETQFSGVILGEIGPLSLAEGLSIAARLNVPALDADTVGRATPEINQHSVRVAGIPLTPTAVTTQFGDKIIVSDVQDPSRTEDIIRAISVMSGIVGVTDSPITGRIAKRPGTLITESLSLAITLGKAVREAKTAGQNPIEAARLAGAGYTLFTGRIASDDWSDSDGFLKGQLQLRGTDKYKGQNLQLDYVNEHLVATRDGKVIATCPDLITVIDATTAEGVNNPDGVIGQDVIVLGFKCNPVWRTSAGLAVFEPRYFGFDLDYAPIETRLG